MVRTLIGMVVIMAGLGGIALSSAHAQAPDSSVDAQVDWAVHGADGTGRDGPMATLNHGLIALYYRYQAHREEASSGEPFTAHENMPVQDSLVTIDAIASGTPAALLDSLKRLGLQKGAQAERLVSGKLPIGALRAAAQLSDLQSMRPAQMSSGLGMQNGTVAPPSDASAPNRDDSAHSRATDDTAATDDTTATDASAPDSTMESGSTASPDSAAHSASEAEAQQPPAPDSASLQSRRGAEGKSTTERSGEGASTRGWRMYAVGGGVLLLSVGFLLLLRRRASHGD